MNIQKSVGDEAMDLSIHRSRSNAERVPNSERVTHVQGLDCSNSHQNASTSSSSPYKHAQSTVDPGASSSSQKTSSRSTSDRSTSNRHKINIFRKHKLKYQYLYKKNHDRSKPTSDSGHFGSSSMQGSSSTTSDKRSNELSSSSYSSSSPSSGTSDSPVNLVTCEGQQSDQQMCMILRQAVPLVVMMKGQLQAGSQNASMSYSDTTIYKCNMCSMFSNNMADVLNHVSTNHSSVHYCFVCNRFHNDRNDYDRHKDVCETAHQAFQQIVGNHYSDAAQSRNPGSQEQPLNLSVAGNVAMRAAQMIHSRRGRQKKIKKLQKCTYCKKAFFGKFYLQRHLRTHTGEKLCHCSICGKGFVEWRNLRNHMSRFHNSSQSSDSGGQSKSVSPNVTSDSDPNGHHSNRGYSSNVSRKPQLTRALSVPSSKTHSEAEPAKVSRCGSGSQSMEFPHPGDILSTGWMTSTQNAASSASSSSGSSASLSSYGPKSEGAMYNSYSEMSYMSESNQTMMSQSGDMKPVTANLGSTSSRLQLTNNESLEQSLNPVCAENGEKFFMCSMCNKTFRTKFAMQRHLDFHADKRPFQCEQCDYKAKTKPQLKVHVMRHSGEKGFHCKICNYACVTHSDLNRHCKSRSHMFRVNVLEGKDVFVSTSMAATGSESVEQIDLINDMNPDNNV